MEQRYRKKPVEVEVVQWTGDNYPEIEKFCTKNATCLVVGELYIETLEGGHHASVGDYIIRGVQGECYPCKPGIFHSTYEKVRDFYG